MSLDKGTETNNNSAGQLEVESDRDPSPPVLEDPEVLAAEAAKGYMGDEFPAALLREHEEIVSATTSVAESFQSSSSDSSHEAASPELDSGVVSLEVDEDEDDGSAALYPVSSYPRANPAYQVEHPYSPDTDDGPDAGTMCVRPLVYEALSPSLPANSCLETRHGRCMPKTSISSSRMAAGTVATGTCLSTRTSGSANT